MFNLGFTEIIALGVLALILIGPKQLPEVAKTLGRLMNEFKKATQDLSGGLLDIKKDLRGPMQDVMAEIQNTARQQVAKIDISDEVVRIKNELQTQIQQDPTEAATKTEITNNKNEATSK